MRRSSETLDQNRQHGLALLWQIKGAACAVGFPNRVFNDSWVVGFWRADHGRHDLGLGRRAWALAQAIPGSPGPQGAATDVSALRGGADRPPAIARAFSRWRSGLRLATMISCTILLLLACGIRHRWKPNCSFKRIGSSAAAMLCW